ncbi:MAG: quinone-dependent dihydroorotate dehydrogenase [Flavobacteriales bacterium]|nr:quinone-dependent dihydroorotate dehydrogenase [Flavobacteriales bacterium]MBL6872767.1 quinone-dependent dihydroorotate dehydrogenase [Flavobacteriales bacterium]
MYRYLIKPLLFLFNPEFIHHFIFNLIKLASCIPFKLKAWDSIYRIKDERLKRTVFGLTFDNPVGLAAGFDKDAKLFNELSSFGFGFIEIGTLTPLAQSGNPKPRLFRLPQDESLINRMGFNNGGVEDAVNRLKYRHTGIIIGGNIGKNKLTPNSEAAKDYELSFEALFDYVDYFVVNVSSPNTPGLRELQEKEPLTKLLLKLQDLNSKKENRKPILLKIAPDLTDNQLDDIIQIVIDTKLDGLIATNTTIDRSGLKTSDNELERIGNGGVSGKAVKNRSTEVIKYISEKSNQSFPIIGVGGIHSAEDAIEKLKAGASLVQIYTGFVYEGPSIVKKINKGILNSL